MWRQAKRNLDDPQDMIEQRLKQKYIYIPCFLLAKFNGALLNVCVCFPQDVEIDLDKLGSNANYHQHGVGLNPKLEKLEFPRNNIIYIRDLGQGAFGRVFLVSGHYLNLIQ